MLELILPGQVEQVARQLVAMSRVNWLKHRLMQASPIATMAGFLLVMIVVPTERHATGNGRAGCRRAHGF